KRIAAVNAREGQMDDAVNAYRALVEADEKDEDAVTHLDKLLRESDKKDDLRWLFERRVARADEKHQLELLTEWASLEEDVFSAPDHAVTIYKRILALVPKH